MIVKIARNLFLDAQVCSNKLQKVNQNGKSYLFQDDRAAVVIANRGAEASSKFWPII